MHHSICLQSTNPFFFLLQNQKSLCLLRERVNEPKLGHSIWMISRFWSWDSPENIYVLCKHHHSIFPISPSLCEIPLRHQQFSQDFCCKRREIKEKCHVIEVLLRKRFSAAMNENVKNLSCWKFELLKSLKKLENFKKSWIWKALTTYANQKLLNKTDFKARREKKAFTA